jgi:S-formylglutathione hydrolase FrmB
VPLLAALAVLLLVGAGVAAWVLLRDQSSKPRARSAASFSSTLGARIERYDLASRETGRTLHPVGVVPAGESAGGTPRPLLVLLHGHGMPPDFFLTDGLFRALRDAGDQAPAVVMLDGDRGSYWHDRAGGRWGSMVLDEAIPDAARRLGADPRRVAVAGISMGGFGALDLARRRPGHFCAVGARSPAIFPSARRAAPGAFDGAKDFRRHDLIRWASARRRPYGTTPVWIDTGRSDRFRKAIDTFAREVPRAEVHRWKGGHDAAYWRAHDRAFTAWAIRALGGCGG